jgi:phage-related protein
VRAFGDCRTEWRAKSHVCIVARPAYDGNAYRAVYTVRYADALYVLHAFQKKSKKGIATPKAEIDLIEKRLKDLIEEKEGRQ